MKSESLSDHDQRTCRMLDGFPWGFQVLLFSNTEVSMLFLPLQKLPSSGNVRLSREGGRYSSVLHILKVS